MTTKKFLSLSDDERTAWMERSSFQELAVLAGKLQELNDTRKERKSQ